MIQDEVAYAKGERVVARVEFDEVACVYQGVIERRTRDPLRPSPWCFATRLWEGLAVPESDADKRCR